MTHVPNLGRKFQVFHDQKWSHILEEKKIVSNPPSPKYTKWRHELPRIQIANLVTV